MTHIDAGNATPTFISQEEQWNLTERPPQSEFRAQKFRKRVLVSLKIFDTPEKNHGRYFVHKP